MHMRCGNIPCPSLSIWSALMQTSAKDVGGNLRLHGSDPLCNIIFGPRGESGLMSVCLPPCAPRVTRRKWGSWIMITVWGWQPLQRESVTFVTLLHHKCWQGEQLSPPIWLSNMNYKQYRELNISVGGDGLLGAGSSVAANFLITFCFLFFFRLPQTTKKKEYCSDQQILFSWSGG